MDEGRKARYLSGPGDFQVTLPAPAMGGELLARTIFALREQAETDEDFAAAVEGLVAETEGEEPAGPPAG
jgi:hypothetical protein